MEDPELAAIRAARMNQLQQGSPAGGAAPSGEDAAQRAAEEEMRHNLLATLLDSAARERCMLLLAIESNGTPLISLKTCILQWPGLLLSVKTAPGRSRLYSFVWPNLASYAAV